MNIGTSLKKFCSIIVLALVAFVLVACGANEAEEYAKKVYIPGHDAINGSFAVPKFVEGNEEVTIEWESSNTEIITIAEYEEWDYPSDDDVFAPTPDLYFKATVILPEEATEVVLKATVSYGKQTAVKELPVTVVADTYEYMTIEDVKDEASVDAAVRVEGVVSYFSNNGFAVEDETGYIYVYRGSGVSVGDKVVVRGNKSVYNNMPQLANAATEKVGEEQGYDAFADVEKLELAEIIAHDDKDSHFYSSLYIVEGIVQILEDEFDPYYIVNPKDTSEFVGVTSYSSADSLEELEDLVGEYVELHIMIYSSYGGDFSVCYVEGSAVQKDVSYTDQEKVDLATQVVTGSLKDAIITESFTLPTAVEDWDAAVTWKSSNETVLSNTGVFTAPAEATEVTLTATVKVGTVEKATDVKVTVVAVEIADVHDLLAITPLSKDDDETLVLIEGVVYGLQYQGYWVLDATGGVYVRDTSGTPKVGEVVQVLGNLASYNPHQSFNMQINPVRIDPFASERFKVLDKAAPETIDPIEISIEDLFALGVDDQETAVAAADTYYGKLLTITGTVRGGGNFWYIDGENEGQFFRLNNLYSNKGLVQGDEVEMTVIVRDIYYIDDTSGYDNYLTGTFGGVFFTEDDFTVK